MVLFEREKPGLPKLQQVAFICPAHVFYEFTGIARCVVCESSPFVFAFQLTKHLCFCFVIFFAFVVVGLFGGFVVVGSVPLHVSGASSDVKKIVFSLPGRAPAINRRVVAGTEKSSGCLYREMMSIVRFRSNLGGCDRRRHTTSK